MLMSSIAPSEAVMHAQDIGAQMHKLKLSDHSDNDSDVPLYTSSSTARETDNGSLTNGDGCEDSQYASGSIPVHIPFADRLNEFAIKNDQRSIPDLAVSALSQLGGLDLSNIPLDSILPLLGLSQHAQNGINMPIVSTSTSTTPVENTNLPPPIMNGVGTNSSSSAFENGKTDIPAPISLSHIKTDIINYMLSTSGQPSNMNGNHLSPIHQDKFNISQKYIAQGQNCYPENYQNMSCMSNVSLQQKISQKKQTMDYLLGVSQSIDTQEKRYMTTTERIKVPSSDHVAEIVGKNGQRIKQLREQLKVWVKTPSRDEPPVFEVTGLPEKLAEAKRIILQMSDHFTKVQQERLQRTEPNRVEDRLYVEQDKVGLIVGASGQTIRWVQQLSDTHIATPRKQETIPGLPPPQTFFTICGTPEKVRFAKQLICEYVMLRCQGLWLDSQLEPSSEAARLVREFHQRRQVEDSQRRNVTPQGSSNTTPVLSRNPMSAGIPPQGRPLVGGISAEKSHGTALAEYLNSMGADAQLRNQIRNDLEDVWGSGAVNSSDSSGPDSPKQNTSWGSSFLYGASFSIGDRRFSADHSAGQGNQNSLGLNLNDVNPLRKSVSDEQVSPATGYKPGPGWM